MATASFKSTSKRHTTNPNCRGNPTSPSCSSKPLRRRSSSVSSVSRISSQHASSEFSNKRDNPLFWTSNSPHIDQVENPKKIANDKEKEKPPFDGFSIDKVTPGSAKCRTTNIEIENRGRSTSRSSGSDRKGIGRSLSRVRCRSASRGRYGSPHESEREQELLLLKTTNQRRELNHVANSSRGSALVENDTDTHQRVSGSQIAAVGGKGTEFSEDASNYSVQNSTGEDGISTGSLSEADDKIIKAFEQSFRDGQWDNDTAASGIYEAVRAEVRRAMSDIQNELESVMRRNSANAISTNSGADIPPNMNPGAAEIVLNIRREYSRKLQESQERTRQLKADLAVEENHGQELNRILEEIVPDTQKLVSPQRSRIARRRSNERKKMSQRLTEEAMAYFDHFDECVSISTFDGSDFSAPEDPPHSSNEATFSDSKSQLEPQGSMECFSGNKQVFRGIGQLSFMHELPKSAETDDDIRSCIRHFERETTLKGAISAEIVASNWDPSAYKLKGQIENIWFHRVLYNKRIDSGGLLICGGGIEAAGFPFGP
ncbi:unnamed protein product [Cuscuta europaea]|uniref:Uncharacterized protein n=1 Tax=Cuscuta europaea TaxID=41803 RepID=A0A9P0YMA8_CUSEU|nr:unnamed protein product [Cuscuta europaea]